MRSLILQGLTLVILGCGGSEASKTPLTMDEVPDNIKQVAKQKLPDVKFDQAFKEPNGSIELRGKDKRGKVREIDIAPDGSVTEIE